MKFTPGAFSWIDLKYVLGLAAKQYLFLINMYFVWYQRLSFAEILFSTLKISSPKSLLTFVHAEIDPTFKLNSISKFLLWKCECNAQNKVKLRHSYFKE